MQDSILSFLGLAAKAGELVSGEFSVEKAVKSGQSHFVIVANDCSERSKKSYTDMCSFYGVDLEFYGTKESLGAAIGKDYRASIAVLGDNFSVGLSKKFANLRTME